MPDCSHIQAFYCDCFVKQTNLEVEITTRQRASILVEAGEVCRVSQDTMTEIQVRRKVLLRFCSMSLCYS